MIETTDVKMNRNRICHVDGVPCLHNPYTVKICDNCTVNVGECAEAQLNYEGIIMRID